MFEGNKLNIIREAARKVKNQGELAVYRAINLGPGAEEGSFTEQELNIIKYCAEECKRQRSGEMSVYDMLVAWDWMQKEVRDFYPETKLTVEIISHIGTLVEPHDNAKGIRTVRVGIWDGTFIEKAPPDRVIPQLEALLWSYYEDALWGGWGLNPISQNAEDEFYFRYEEIHPFVDGNGRSGKIIYNYLCGTLDNPIMPPNFFGGSNP